MADFSNIPTGLKINSQIPLDVKGYALNEATLAYLGVDDNLAFTYHEGIRIVCIQESTVYEWREVQAGEENTGLVPVDYTYPSDLEDVYGINYSNRTFNFFLINEVTPETLEDYVLQIDLPEYDIQQIGFQNTLTASYQLYDGKETIVNDTFFKFKGLSTGAGNSTSAISLSESTYTDPMTDQEFKNVFIGFSPFIEETNTASLIGDGSFVTPFEIITKNYQKEINTFPYELTDDDDQCTLFIVNAASNVEIRIPDTLKGSFICTLNQEGTGEVTITGLGAVVLNTPSGLTNKIKGQYHWAILEKKLNTTSHYLGGSLMLV